MEDSLTPPVHSKQLGHDPTDGVTCCTTQAHAHTVPPGRRPHPRPRSAQVLVRELLEHFLRAQRAQRQPEADAAARADGVADAAVAAGAGAFGEGAGAAAAAAAGAAPSPPPLPLPTPEGVVLAGELMRIIVTEAVLRAKKAKVAVLAAAAGGDGVDPSALGAAVAGDGAPHVVALTSEDVRAILPTLLLDFA